MFPLQKFTATSKWVNQLKQGTLTGPFVFVIGYNLKVEYIFGTRKQQNKYRNEKIKTTTKYINFSHFK